MHDNIVHIMKKIHQDGGRNVDEVHKLIEDHISHVKNKFLPVEKQLHILIQEYISHLIKAREITHRIKQEGGHIGGHHPVELLKHLENAHNLIFKIETLINMERKESKRHLE